MKRFLAIGIIALALGGCRTSAAEYSVAFKSLPDKERQSIVASALMRVVVRRMERIGEEILEKNVQRSGSGLLLRVSAENGQALQTLTDELTQPFTLRIMREAKTGETPTIQVEGHGGFMEAGITEEHVEWLEAAPEADEKGRITMMFTETGRERMRTIFKENKGKYIGLFVRNQLIAKLLVDTDELKDQIVISEIPTVELAQVFTDDVNLGLHAVITPLP